MGRASLAAASPSSVLVAGTSGAAPRAMTAASAWKAGLPVEGKPTAAQARAAANLAASAAATADGTKPDTSPPSRAISFTSREAIAW